MYEVEIKDGNTFIKHDGTILGRVQRMVIEVGTEDLLPRMHLDIALTPMSRSTVVAAVPDERVTVTEVPVTGPVWELGDERQPVDFVPPGKTPETK
jgi:hypothetical protein